MLSMLSRWNESVKHFTAVPERALFVYLLASLAFWTLQCSLLQNILGLDILETITWGAQCTWGHAKHPPLSGWIGYGFSCLAGHADWGMYLAAQCCLFCGVWFIYRTARLFMENFSAAAAALLTSFLFYYTPSEMKFCTYFVELALVPLAAWSFFSALQRQKVRFWLAFGAFCGLGMLNKYSFGLQIAGFALVMLVFREYRKQLFSFRPWLALLPFFALFSPHLVWLYQHDFICLKHVSSRLGDLPDPWLPLIVLGAVLYPFGMQLAVVLLARLRGIRTAPRKPVERPLALGALLLSLLPGLLFQILSLCGEDVILMWLCSSCSWTGVAVLAALPFAVDHKLFHRIWLLLVLYTVLVFAGSTADLLDNARPRIHMRPEDLTAAVRGYWQKHRGAEPIPLVIGDRWYACALENYLPERPPACEAGDSVMEERYRELAARRGGLLIGRGKDLRSYLERTGSPALKLDILQVSYRAVLGEEEKKFFFIGVLPPRAKQNGQAGPDRKN